MKKILFDAGPLMSRNVSGVGRYLELMISALKLNYGENISLTGYYFRFAKRKSSSKEFYNGNKLLRIRFLPGKLLAAVRLARIRPPVEIVTRFKNYDSVLFTNFVDLPVLSSKSMKKILFIYDLCFLDCPEYVQGKNLKYLKSYAEPSIRRADAIVTISNYTKSRIIKFFPELNTQIIVTPIPPTMVEQKKRPLSSRLKEMGVERKKYILFVGTVEPRKNLKVLLDSLSRLDEPIRSELKIVIAGGKGWKDSEILKTVATMNETEPKVIMCGYVTDAEKNELYTNASCFVLPSHYEGFGMPVLEAMLFQLPIILSDIEVFHEVAGKSVIYFNKNSSEDLANKITTLLTNKTLQKNMVAKYPNQLSKYSWSDNAKKLYKIL